MKLVYLPPLAVNNIGFLQHLLFDLVPGYVSVKILYFHYVLEQKNTKQKSYAKSFKIVQIVAYGRTPTKLKLTILGRIAYFINGLKSINRCFIVVIL